MWTFDITLGVLEDDEHSFAAYSGAPGYVDNPNDEALADEGPIPEGNYTIGSPYTSDTHGPFVMMLLPAASNNMHGRSGFLIHGDRIGAPGTASKGCIVTSRAAREAVWASGDRQLTVIR